LTFNVLNGNDPLAAAQIYDREWVPALFGKWAQNTAKLAPAKAGEAALDVACGTGVVARLVAAQTGITGRVTGIDLNPCMLEVARMQSALQDDLSLGSVEWRQADACKLPFPDASFQVAYCQFGLQFFADRVQALREMRRILVPKGRVALMVWGTIEKSPGFAILARALERNIGATEAQVVRAAYSLGSPSEMRSMMEAAGFCNVSLATHSESVQFRSVDHFITTCLTGSRLGEAISKVDHCTRRIFIDRVRAGLARYERPDGLCFPVEALLVHAPR
jgi:ubiquinone/menaquinone biosynthesis C-methylase UbiE